MTQPPPPETAVTEPDPNLPTPPPPGQPGVNRYGRRGALTQDLQDRIIRVVRAGNYLKVAAQFCGIGESTLRLWLSKGRKAAAARDAHDPDRLYCPGCDADRTAAAEEVRAANLREDDRRAERPHEEPSTYAVLGRCPSCGSGEHPRTWELPEEEVRYLSFLEAVTQAETAAEVAAVTHWRAAFADDWRAARDYLVRSKPDRWAATTRVQISQEEADRRIEAATLQVLTSVGVDTEVLGQGSLLAGDLDPAGDLDLDLDADWPGEGDGDA